MISTKIKENFILISLLYTDQKENNTDPNFKRQNDKSISYNSFLKKIMKQNIRKNEETLQMDDDI